MVLLTKVNLVSNIQMYIEVTQSCIDKYLGSLVNVII